MQDPTPKTTKPVAPISKSRCGSAEETKTKIKFQTNKLKHTKKSPPTLWLLPINVLQWLIQWKLRKDTPAPTTNVPAPTTNAPTQNNPLDELIAGVESLQVQDPHALQVQYEVVLRRDLYPHIRIVRARFSPRRHKLTSITGPFAVVVTRNGVQAAYININIHYPEAYIEKARMGEAAF
ncbi:hypothetical protein BJ741DRAFT_585135 [Chytriomyces cf. hyalinus JEL632]|nr:hypothetical protein BJ741DRAFT_585135 [Chytriomyces cf. hyalinus JEL632]